MSQTKPKRASSSAKFVGQRNETPRISNNSISKRQDKHSSYGKTIHQTKANASNKNNFVHVCSGCNKPIRRDKFLLKACDKYWHENCLKCDRCHSRLGELGSTLYRKSNMNLCRQDYLEMFGKTGVCSVCEKLICASEMVMRAKENVYHLECFACQLCSQRFCVGDRFYLCENKVVCQYDYEEHILPIQQSLIAEQTADSIYSTNVISHQDTTTIVQLNTTDFGAENNDSMIEQNPVESKSTEPEGGHLRDCSSSNSHDIKDKTVRGRLEEVLEKEIENSDENGGEPRDKNGGGKDTVEFEVPSEAQA